MSTEFYGLAVAITVIVSAARLTRLATVDVFPPVKWIREKYADLTDGSDWFWLMYCGYCFSFWATALVLGTAYASGVLNPLMGIDPTAEVWTRVWWIVNGTFAASYVAAIVMAHDGDNSGDDTEGEGN